MSSKSCLCNLSIFPCIQTEALGPYGQTFRSIYKISGDINNLTSQYFDTHNAPGTLHCSALLHGILLGQVPTVYVYAYVYAIIFFVYVMIAASTITISLTCHECCYWYWIFVLLHISNPVQLAVSDSIHIFLFNLSQLS